MHLTKLSMGLCLLLFMSLSACLTLDEISFITFQADFDSPINVRVNEEISLSPSNTTEGAKSHDWFIQELDTLISVNNLRFSFDSIGLYTIRLISSIDKTEGLLKDSTDKNILVLPNTDTLQSTQEYGEFTDDESLQDVLALPDSSGYFLLSRKSVSILELRRLNQLGQELWRSEFPNLTRGRIQGENIHLTSDGNLLVVGGIQISTQENDAFILLLEVQEDEQRAVVLWQEIINSVENEFYTSVVEVNQNNEIAYYALGTVSSSGQTTLLIDRYSTEGILEDSETFESVCSSCKSNQAFLIPEGDEPILVVAGQEVDNPAVFEFVLGSENVQLRDKSIISQLQGEAYKATRLVDGKFALVGAVSFGASDSTEAFVAKLDVISASIVPLWVTRLSFYQERFEDIIEDSNNDLIAIGTHFNPLSGEDIIFGQFDTFSGEVIETRLLGTPFNEGAIRLFPFNNGWLSFGQIENNTFLEFRDIQIAEIILN